MNDKFMTSSEAVKNLVKNGDQIAIGGFTVNRNPMSITREIIRQNIKNLQLIVHSQGQAFELLIGAGSISKLELAYGGLGRFASTSCRLKKAFK
jgi:glutaconate CoA-transferase subunit A